MGTSKANILIDETHRARLADFGLLTIISGTTKLATPSSSFTHGGTYRWMSPELFAPDKFGLADSRRTEHSDCYAFGMVILEVLTGQVPFSGYNDMTVVTKVVDGERPERPQGPERVWFTDDLWEMLGQCWLPQPEVRPTIEAVLERLERGSTAWQPLPPSAGDDVRTDSNDESTFTVSYCPGMFFQFALRLRSHP